MVLLFQNIIRKLSNRQGMLTLPIYHCETQTYNLRVIPCCTGRYGVSSNLVEANFDRKTVRIS